MLREKQIQYPSLGKFVGMKLDKEHFKLLCKEYKLPTSSLGHDIFRKMLEDKLRRESWRKKFLKVFRYAIKVFREN